MICDLFGIGRKEVPRDATRSVGSLSHPRFGFRVGSATGSDKLEIEKKRRVKRAALDAACVQ